MTHKILTGRIIMAEDSPITSPASDFEQTDLSSDAKFLGSSILDVKSFESDPGTFEMIIDDDPNRLQRIAEKYGGMSFKRNQAESKEDDSLHETSMKFPDFSFADDNIKQSFFEIARINNSTGLIELDIEILERKASSLNLDKTEDSPQKANYVQLLREKLLEYSEMLEKDETTDMQTKPEEDLSTEELKTERLAPYKYEKKNKLWDRKPHLREMSREFPLHQFHEVNFTEGALETLRKGLINHVELDLNCAVNILRRIAYPKLCEKHFLPEFPSGAFAVEDEPHENISIGVDHFEFLHKELPINFLQLFESKDFYVVASDWEKDPQINNMVPSFIKFLQNDSKKFRFPEKCFTLILSILKNPYRKFESFYDEKLPVVKEQKAISVYLVNCLKTLEIVNDKDAFEKLAEAIIMFANIHPFLHGLILEGFNALFCLEISDVPAIQIYCKVLNIMTSIGATFVGLCLPRHFEKISCLATQYQKCDLYFHLLRACEISFANTIEYEVDLDIFSEDFDLSLFYIACYNYFGRDLTIRLIPVYRKYETRKNREEQYLSKKHAVFPTKYGYMDMEMLFLINRNKIKAESKSLNFPKVKECTTEGKEWNSAGKVLFSSSNTQLGYIIQKDMHELSDEDLDYWYTIDEFPLSYLEGVTDELSKNN